MEGCTRCAELQIEAEDLRIELQSWKNMVKWVAVSLHVDGKHDDLGNVDIGREMLAQIAALNYTISEQDFRLNTIGRLAKE